MNGTRIFVDVGHNEDGIRRSVEYIKHSFPNHSLELVLGLSANKDISSLRQFLELNCHSIHLIKADHSRAMSTKELKTQFPTADYS